MEIIKKTEGLGKMDLYKMVLDSGVKPIKSVAGSQLTYEAYCLYSDIDNNGNEVELLAIKAQEGCFTTNSKTFIEDFKKALEFLDESDITTIFVKADKSKSDRTYYRCSILA